MNKISHSTILDFGHSKLRLGVFNENLDHIYLTSKNIIEKENYEEYSKTINLIIKDAEKNISDHLENIIVLYDSSNIRSIDLSIKKDFDQNVNFKDINFGINNIFDECDKTLISDSASSILYSMNCKIL